MVSGSLQVGIDHNTRRPNHIHFSLFGPTFLTRLVTQMYLPGDPLLDLDPICGAFSSMPSPATTLRTMPPSPRTTP
jgi:protocatechuate 3,4-dioxygenase beta subunit